MYHPIITTTVEADSDQDHATRWIVDTGSIEESILLLDFHTEEDYFEFYKLMAEGRNHVNVVRFRQRLILEDLVAVIRRDGLAEPPAYTAPHAHPVTEEEPLPELIPQRNDRPMVAIEPHSPKPGQRQRAVLVDRPSGMYAIQRGAAHDTQSSSESLHSAIRTPRCVYVNTYIDFAADPRDLGSTSLDWVRAHVALVKVVPVLFGIVICRAQPRDDTSIAMRGIDLKRYQYLNDHHVNPS
ncbi:hypothetical protein C8Q76DRAFT_695124 [Earliella scabrosa]|nr:hypothetical protein C8Q76DRAFT_695124 [Earliella scabrosa]